MEGELAALELVLVEFEVEEVDAFVVFFSWEVLVSGTDVVDWSEALVVEVGV